VRARSVPELKTERRRQQGPKLSQKREGNDRACTAYASEPRGSGNKRARGAGRQSKPGVSVPVQRELLQGESLPSVGDQRANGLGLEPKI
jgi:hypothetical protein